MSEQHGAFQHAARPAQLVAEVLHHAVQVRSYRRAWTVARLLATAGAVLFAVAAWLPWSIGTLATGSATFNGSAAQRINLDPALAGAPPLVSLTDPASAFLLWSALTILGVVLLPLLWSGARPLLSGLAVALFFLWAAGSTVVAVVASPLLLQQRQVALYLPESGGVVRQVATLDLAQHQIALGYWLAVAALALAWLAVTALCATEVLRGHVMEPPAERHATEATLHGRSALGAAAVLWAIGYLWLPWATAQCSNGGLFFGGQCAGLSATGALRYALSTAGPTAFATGQGVAFDPQLAYYAVGLLLGGGALLLVLAALRPRHAELHLPLWATLWLVAAASVAVLTDQGLGIVVGHAAALGLPGGPWRGESGVWVTALGLLVGLVGVALAWTSLVRRRPLAQP